MIDLARQLLTDDRGFITSGIGTRIFIGENPPLETKKTATGPFPPRLRWERQNAQNMALRASLGKVSSQQQMNDVFCVSQN
jgi:hypothetical protein